MTADILRPVFARVDESPVEIHEEEQWWDVDREEVLALHALVREIALPEALQKGRKVWHLDDDPLTEAFCVMQSGSYEVVEGFSDRFVAVRLAEQDMRSGRMILSFLTTQKLPKSNVNGIRTIHRFEWTADTAFGQVLKVQTGKVEDETVAINVTDNTTAKSNHHFTLLDSSDTSQKAITRAPKDDETFEIADRMMAIIAAASPRTSPRSVMNCANYYLDLLDRGNGQPAEQTFVLNADQAAIM